MKGYYFVGLDVHKKTVSYCVKEEDGTVVDRGKVRATREGLLGWVEGVRRPWIGAMEATMFTGWIYDVLVPHARELKVGHPLMLRLISGAKKKSDRIDARKLADLLRCDLFPESYMAPVHIRQLRRVLRYRGLVKREAKRMKNKTSGLLMEVGAEYAKNRLHGKRYFSSLLETIEDAPQSVVELLKLTRGSLELFEAQQQMLVRELKSHPDLRARVERLMTIPGVGEITALTWALEVGDPHRFSSRRKAVSYCGLCSGQNESAGKTKRGPLSKQRNRHLQSVLIEAAKMAPRWNIELAQLYDRERQRGAHHNRATLAVARKLVAYLMSVDKNQKEFQCRAV